VDVIIEESRGTTMSIKIKNGMGGSHNGKSRWEPTEFLKKISKKRRRRLDKLASRCYNDSRVWGT